MPGLNDFLTSPLFDHVLLSKGLVLFTLFLLAIRFFPEFPRKLTLLLVSLVLIEIATSPFYVFLFVAFVGLFYYLLLFWLQWSPRKKEWSYLVSGLLIVFYFLLMNHPALRTPWTGQLVHKFGIAYSLFRLLSVVFEVGRGSPLPADPLDYFIYLFFAPTFFQGPIERLDEFQENLQENISEVRPLSLRGTGSEIIRIAGAFVKGWLVLRFLTLDWKDFFDTPQHYSYLFLWWGVYVRAISFYLFVSAANDLTIACSALAGYRVHENYDYPYFKRNLAEFWRSWHMTLVRFLRDYIYIPLGGNRRHIFFNFLVIFLTIALWHVTSWAFLIWGLWHGLGMCVLRIWQNFWKQVEQQKTPKSFYGLLQDWSRSHPRFIYVVSNLLTFHFVAISWLPFWGGHPQGVNLFLRLISGNHWKLFLW